MSWDQKKSTVPIHWRKPKSEAVAVCKAKFEDSFFTRYPKNVTCSCCKQASGQNL